MTTYDDVNQTYYTAYYVNQTGYDVLNNPVAYTLLLLPTPNSGLVPVMLQTQAASADNYSVSFYDMDNTFLLQMGVTDGGLSSVSPGNPSTNSFLSFFNGWGNCLVDVYSGHGGASGLAIIATAYYPPTVAYFALRCAAVNVHLL